MEKDFDKTVNEKYEELNRHGILTDHETQVKDLLRTVIQIKQSKDRKTPKP